MDEPLDELEGHLRWLASLPGTSETPKWLDALETLRLENKMMRIATRYYRATLREYAEGKATAEQLVEARDELYRVAGCVVPVAA